MNLAIFKILSVSMSSSAVRSWRTAFLTLRDENSASPPCATIVRLLDKLILSPSDSLVAAAPQLPPHELTSDLILLLELARDLSYYQQGIEDVTQTFVKLSALIHAISHSSSLEMNSIMWGLVLDSFKRIVQVFFGNVETKRAIIRNVALIKPTKNCLESLRLLFSLYQTAASPSENGQLLNFVLEVVACFQGDSKHSTYFSDNYSVSRGVCEVLTIAFAMIGEAYSRVGASLPVEIWKSTIVVLRKVMDILASKGLLMEDYTVATFYVELLQCLHLVLAEPRGYLAEHVAGFVASLRIFFRYGLVNKPSVMNQPTNHLKGVGSTSQNMPFEVSNQPKSGPYRPPHLRKKVAANQQRKHEESLVSSGHEFISSDSDCSDNDGSVMDNSKAYLAKARLAAIICVQDLCRADPKLFTAQWTMLLPSNDVLQHRNYDTTLMSCFLSDPSLKVRIEAASTIMAMLDGPASVPLQVAEFKEHSKHGSFTTLSSSLGHILMQLHSGTLYLIKHETSNRVLALSFKILMLLIASTPYSRMPPELLSRIISSLQSTIEKGFPYHNDRNSLLAASIVCLTRALSVPASMCVNNMLLGEISSGCLEGQSSGVLFTLFQYSERLSTPSISLEALQALKSLSHNYPNVMTLCWEQISSIIYGVLSTFPDESSRLWRGNVEQTAASLKERVTTAAVKVLDESLRAISGFKGTEDLSTDKSLDSPFTSDFVKTKAISSAPSYSLETPVSTVDDSQTCILASERWLEATIKHMPLIINHSSAMVRAASVTCFAGMTSPVFISLPEDKQEYLTVSSINAALYDEVPSVRSAACRAIGVIGCFPQIYHSAEVLEKFILAAECNAHDSLVSVRITASWALANICDSLSHCLDALYAGRSSIGSTKCFEYTSLLVDSALRLARDNDKVKANAVRGLGNLARSIQFIKQLPINGDPLYSMPSKIEYHGGKGFKDHVEKRSQSVRSSPGSFDWLDQMVQAFLSCVTTGNVKVQWNVCHALSNLFLNKSLKLQDMDWTSSVFSILLLLLRDSSNFKIRIQAAAALAAPETINDYGKSYYDVVKSVEHIVENFKSDQIAEPSNFKYRIALEKQLTSTMLHLLALASRCDQRAIQDLLVKKASFLEVWIQNLCSSVGDTSNSLDEAKHASVDQKRDVIYRTIQSLVQVYESSNHHLLAQSLHGRGSL
ncbi:HEAT repeat-containing protein 6-like isoform X1 [Salvia splendens]|uniref:HEAT repeat-containing protein 6-like isoform X1 n=2 Tax=Salvia splendens TaxID=180675 RepID=UPI001C26957C|nr:HEAT repeat-containing protein 6-like isoform X1 [Salvia splendens]